MKNKNQDKIENNCYLVGGAVRDQLLGIQVKDKDWVVVGQSKDIMLQAGFTQVGKDFPVFLHPVSHDEYALARIEKKQGHGYTGFSCYAAPDVSLEQDLQRRDLTINAMAQAADGSIIDPFNGQHDLKEKKLRHVSDAFIEDPLRVLRVARFAARYHDFGFSIAKETFTLMKQLAASGELDNLTPERIWLETQKALTEQNASVYFQILNACGALACILPELSCLWGVPNPELWHPEIDTGVHTMMVLQQACKLSPSIPVRFAALCHDLGKGVTEKEQWPSHHGHEKAGVNIIEQLTARLRIPNDCKELACIVSEFHLHSHKAYELTEKTILKLFNKTDAWRKPERFKDYLLACQADFRGRLSFDNRPYPQMEYLTECLKHAAAVDVKSIVESGVKGKAIREALDKQRLMAIKQLKEQQ